MYEIIITSAFKKDLKKIGKSSLRDLNLVQLTIKVLKEKGVTGIPQSMRPHKLKGKYKDNWECHIKPGLLIIWIQIESPKKIKLIRVGSHSNLF